MTATPHFLLPPNHPDRNRHHSGQYESEADWWDENFSRGPGDPDAGYPGEPEDTSPSKPLPMLDFMGEIEAD